MRILVVEDHTETRSLVQSVLQAEGYEVVSVGSLREARSELAESRCTAIVLDWILPDGSGPDLCRDLRLNGDATPVLMLTARGDVEDRVVGLDAGADDYLRKPFAIAELKARVRALLRRGPQIEEPTIRVGEVEIRRAARSVAVAGKSIPLTSREFDILDILVRHRGRAVSRSTILLAVWGAEDDAAAASLEVLIARLRRKIVAAGGTDLVATHRGFGYAFRAEP